MAVRISLHYGVPRPLRRRAGCAERPTQTEDHARCRRVLSVRFVSIGSSYGHTDNGRDCSSAKSGTAHCAVQEHKHARRERAALARSHARPFSLRIRIDLLHRLPVVALRLRLRSRFLLPSLQNVELTLASRQHYFMICCFQTDLQASAGTGDAAVALQVRQVHMHAAASFE